MASKKILHLPVRERKNNGPCEYPTDHHKNTRQHEEKTTSPQPHTQTYLIKNHIGHYLSHELSRYPQSAIYSLGTCKPTVLELMLTI